MTRNLGKDLATRSSELKSSDDRNKELEAKYDSLTSEFKSLQVKSIELEKNLSGRNIEFKTLEESMKKQKEDGEAQLREALTQKGFKFEMKETEANIEDCFIRLMEQK